MIVTKLGTVKTPLCLFLAAFIAILAGCGEGNNPRDAGFDAGVSCGDHGAPADGGCVCEEGWLTCTDTEPCSINSAINPDNCFRCGHKCPAGAVCEDGICSISSPVLGVSGVNIVDENGFTVYLNGINVQSQSKYTQDHMPALNDDDPPRIAAMGMNSVRFLLFHEALEPAKGVYDSAYIALARSWIKRFTDLGLWVVLDMHQDVYGVGFKGFNGLSYWTCDEKYYKAFKPVTPWSMNYMEPNVQACFAQFWTDGEKTAHFCEAAAGAAAANLDDPYVIGMDFFNEPFYGAGMTFEDFEKIYLSDLYKKCAGKLIETGFDRLIFVEPFLLSPHVDLTQLDMKGIKAVTPKTVFAPHYYLPTVHDGEPYDGNKAPIEKYIGYVASYARSSRVPMWLGEYGGDYRSGGVTQYFNDLIGILNGYGSGRAYYAFDFDGNTFSPYNPDRTPRPVIMDAVAKPYVERKRGDVTMEAAGLEYTFTSQSSGHVIMTLPAWYTWDSSSTIRTLSTPGPKRILFKVTKDSPVTVVFTKTQP